MAKQTEITVVRPSGETEMIIRDGTITDESMRRKMEQATRDAGKGEIVSWRIIGRTAPLAGCPHYTTDQGCPLHGETCR